MTTSFNVVLKYDTTDRGKRWNRVLSSWDTSDAAETAAEMWRQISPEYRGLIEVMPLEGKSGIPIIFFGAQVVKHGGDQFRVVNSFDVKNALPKDSVQRNKKGNITSVLLWANTLEERETRVQEILTTKSFKSFDLKD